MAVEPLQVYERNGDGHTLARHCDQAPGADARRLADEPSLASTGSFTTAGVAQHCTEECVSANREEVLAWRGSGRRRLVIGHDMGEVVGSVLTRSRWLSGASSPLPATLVLTVLRRNPAYRSGFAVRTSYPVRREPRPHPTPVHIEEG